MESTVLEILERAVLPILTLIGGWFAHLIRSKQKKEHDILENVMQILNMQKEYIAEQDVQNKETRDINKRLEAKLDKKNKSIRKANWCKYTNEGDGCPVLVNEEKFEEDKCETCKYHSNDNGED